MKKDKTRTSPHVVRDADADTMRPEYDFSKGVRGATAKQLRELVSVARRATVRTKSARKRG